MSGVTALRYLDVPMYSVLRRSTTLAVMIGELVMFRSVPSTSLSMSVILMVFGAALAGSEMTLKRLMSIVVKRGLSAISRTRSDRCAVFAAGILVGLHLYSLDGSVFIANQIVERKHWVDGSGYGFE